jgi:hypothetical protein
MISPYRLRKYTEYFLYNQLFNYIRLPVLARYMHKASLIELYETWGKPEKAEEWRAKLPQTKH